MKIKQNKILSFFLALLMFVSVIPMGAVTAFAETDGNFEYYVISEEEKTCAITHYDGSAYELTIPSQLNGYTVTRIGRGAFYFCTSLGSVIIPDSVTYIERDAFYYCESLIKIEIPDSVIFIGDHAFEQTLYYNSESNWENGVLYIGNHLIDAKASVSGDYTVKQGTKTLADCALSYTAVTSVEIPDSVTHIGSSAFEGCKELTSVIIPDSVTSIWDYAFDGCPSLTIYGYSDSYAKAYAEINNIPFIAVILRYSKAQIRFHGIGADKDTSEYAHKFDVRTVAKITEKDFLDTFTSEENAKDKISDFGFVYAAKSKVADFDIDTAKVVAEGGEAENYVKKSVTYMQHKGDGEDYIFTCIISDIDDNDTNKQDGINCLAYVCFDGKYYYFASAATVSFNELYTANMPS
ncbi:MAG: leucine-rich repeat domain-containing protein [Oscillospiraceae bacterium]|nr:leucine-rich repeat domain-containing protein [Oscillospiraceae bacterium]